MVFGDVTAIAAVAAALTGLVAAVVGGINLAFSLRRERPALAVFIREWAADRRGDERYFDVVASNVGHRPVTVVSIGLWLAADDRRWRIDDGTAKPELPAKLEDGETVVMTWLREELGQEHHSGEASIAGCFAVDGRGREVRGSPPRRQARQAPTKGE